jgi:hypothetical protein
MAHVTLSGITPFGTRISGAWVRRLWHVVIMLLTAIPIVHLTHLLLSTGANTLGNDFATIAPLLGRILDGQYNWLHFFRDSFLNSHADALPVLMLTVLARVADLNDTVAISFGLLTTFGMIVVLYKSLTHLIPGQLKHLVLPIAAFLFFSNAQITTLVFNFTNFQLGFSFAGFAFALWAIVHYPKTWRSIVLAVIGGCIAAWSSGFGVGAWPALFACLLLYRYRNLRQYAVFLGGGLLAALPYLSFMQVSASVPTSFTRFSLILEIIGLPLGRHGSAANFNTAGFIGVALVAGGLGLLVWQKGHLPRAAIPPLTAILYALAGAYFTSISRNYPNPWYVPFGCLFWTGLAALALIVYPKNQPQKPIQWLSWLWVATFAIGFVWLYINANNSYLSKAMFMWVRTPVSASCVRYYRSAPSFCEQFVFQWPGGNPADLARLAAPLERHQLTNFSARQTWMLQGDFALDNVVLHQYPSIPRVQWSLNSDDPSVQGSGWSDFRHSNVLIHAPNSVDWTVAIPLNTVEATFSSSVAISETRAAQEFSPTADGVIFEVRIQTENGRSTTVFQHPVAATDFTWHPFTIPLTDYAGQTITLTLATLPQDNPLYDWGLYRFPRIDILLDSATGSTSPQLDLRQLISKSPDDLVLTAENWQLANLQVTAPQTWQLKDNSTVYQAIDACAGDFTYVSLQLTVPASPDLHMVVVKLLKSGRDPIFTLDDEAIDRLEDAALPTMVIPVYADGESHTYTYPLRLLSLGNDNRLQGLGLLFDVPEGTQIRVEDVRLLRATNSVRFCP